VNIPPVEPRGAVTKKKIKLYLNLVKHVAYVFTVMEANITTEKLIYYQLNGYTLYSSQKYEYTQIDSGILIGVRNSLCTEFKIVKERGNLEDKSKIVKVNV
jgi:hypothetical protein